MITLARTDDALSRRGELIAKNYLVGEVLGVGGMGVVYAAVQRSLDRVVALKLPRPELVGDPVVRRRLRSEALAGSRISHRNIVRVFDYGTEDDVPFVVMEHVAGPRLAQLLVELGPLPVIAALGIARQIVSGLEETHAHGIAHADVKCDNVLIETLRDGTLVPRLIDFGIARFVAERTQYESGDRMITGTPEYLAPEVICGEAPGFTADVYAIGVLLYELVSGATPFAGGSGAQVMNRRLDDEVVPLAMRCPGRDIPAAFDSVVARALARDPAARFANASELARALDGVALAVPRHVPTRTHASTPPPIFSTEATTATISAEAVAASRTTRDSVSANARSSLERAIASGSADTIVVTCLDLARTLVDKHRLAAAITELEAGIALLSHESSAPVWRLQLTLAALYDGVGDRASARVAVAEARQLATRCKSTTGCERADQLSARLARRRSSTRRPRPW